MPGYGSFEIWLIILSVAIGTFFLRYSFLGAIGNRPMPEWVLRMLRYTAVAVLPALAAPLVLWPAATEGQTDPARLAAAIVTVITGLVARNALAAIIAGAVTLAIGLYLS
ncbi:Branched-chain amino acid transport protein [Paracoccus isoporae]|uniref:Branched-chain amino acid transport protein n=1 Tax=Paracoccus isoporae TaxID=591205 RepID=A0A1G6Z150_9RHOB|nr:AzlD domain-containing protein [Paracoccus isoporae]SDD96474.1 Branched-chain amino acid transport protein [Paracoccus isoporae]